MIQAGSSNNCQQDFGVQLQSGYEISVVDKSGREMKIEVDEDANILLILVPSEMLSPEPKRMKEIKIDRLGSSAEIIQIPLQSEVPPVLPTTKFEVVTSRLLKEMVKNVFVSRVDEV